MKKKENNRIGKTYSYVIILSFFIILSMLLISCGAKDRNREKPEEPAVSQKENQVHLSVFYSGDDVNWVSALEDLAERFMREHPDIVLDMEHAEMGIYTEDLKAKEALNEFPDIFEIKAPSMFAKEGMLGELPKEVRELVEEPVMIDHRAYAVPMYTTTYGIVYNQVLFKKYNLSIPSTYDDFLEVCKVLQEQGVTPLALGGSREDAPAYWLNYFFQKDMVANTPDWQKKRNQGRVSFQDAKARNMLRNYKDLTTSTYILEDSINMKDNQLAARMVEGDVAMIYTGPWIFSQIFDAYPEAAETDKDTLGEIVKEDGVKCRLGWFFMPDEGGEPVVLNKFGAEWAISDDCRKDAKKSAAATLFFQYFFQKSNYQKILQTMYGIPTTKEAILYPAPVIWQRLLVDYRYAKKSKSYLGNNETPEGFDRVLYKVLTSLVSDVMSIKTAGEKLDASWEDEGDTQ